MPNVENRVCCDCCAYQAIDLIGEEGESQGECRGCLPIPGKDDHGTWPIVSSDDWCMHHRTLDEFYEEEGRTMEDDNPYAGGPGEEMP